MHTGDIPKESHEALIVTIPKPGKPHDEPAKYLPISLLNSDLKIYAKILATRISSFIPKLVHKDEVGFVPHRQASDGTRRFINLIQWAEHHKTPSLLLSLDTEKVFDRVHWSYLRVVL